MIIKIYRDPEGKVKYNFEKKNDYTGDELIGVLADLLGKIKRVEHRMCEHGITSREDYRSGGGK